MTINLSFFIILISSFFTLLPTTIYKEIQPHVMCNLEWEDEEWPNESFLNHLNRCFDYQSNMQPFKKRKTVLQLFDKITAQYESENSRYHNVLYDMATAQDINLLCGAKKNDPYIAEIINRTQTEFGRISFYGTISSPTDNIKLLEQRKKITQHLLTNEQLFNTLKSMVFAPISETENMLLSFWQRDGFLQSSKRSYYKNFYIKKYLNNSPLALELRSLFDHQGRAIQTISNLFATVLLPIYALSLITNITLPNQPANLAQRFQGSAGPFFLIYLCCSNNPYIAAAGTSLVALCTAGNTQENFSWARDCIHLENLLHKKMVFIAQFFKALGALKSLLLQNPEFVELCPEAQQLIQEFIKLRDNKQTKKFIKLLSTATFKANETIFFDRGKTLVAYRQMHELKEQFEPIFVLLGQLDAYLSCATLYKEFSNQEVTFCFPEYLQSPTPYINFTQFWNPLIDHNKVITNDLILGDTTHRNCIVTGPNAGGKSALIKGIVINLILAQSIGFSAAQKALITPFHTIGTYLNVVDDIASGNSLFKAQVLRAQEMIAIAEKTPLTMFCFIALDEMFNGASAQESQAAAYSVAEYLGNFPNSMCILATHFPLLTLLEKNSSVFTNYKVSVEVDVFKGIHYPFKLLRGISDQHIALDILKNEGFDTTIIQQASKILNRKYLNSTIS